MVIAIDGLSLGAIYALIALGYTMVYGIAKMLNFAHGDVIMVGAYMIYTMCTLTWTTGSIPIWLGALISFVIAVVVCTVLGMVIEKVAYKPLRGASPLAALITAIGVSFCYKVLHSSSGEQTRERSRSLTAFETSMRVRSRSNGAVLSP